MTTIQISGFPSATTLADADITHIKQGTTDKKATMAQIKTAAAVAVKEEGSTVVAQPKAINFSGEGVSVTDDSGVADVAIIAGSSEDNLIINGNFDIWQRGTSFTYTNSFAPSYADRWRVQGTGGGTVSRQNHVLGQTDVPGEPAHFLRTTGGSGAISVIQLVEGARSLAGRTITVSFYLRTASATSVRTQVIQRFGIGGSGDVTQAASFESATVGAFAKHSFTYTTAGLSGKTIGTGSHTYISIESNSTPNNFDISQVKVEIGDTATPFKRRHPSEELALCQRYYQKTYELDVFPGDTSENKEGAFFGVVVGGASTIGSYHGPVRMRDTPSVTFYSARTGGASGTFWDVLSNTDKAVTAVASGETGTGVNLNVAASTTTTMGGHIVLDAEL